MSKRYGEIARAIQRHKDRWAETHPGQPMPRDLYRADLYHNKARPLPPEAALEALQNSQLRYDRQLTRSWEYEKNITREPVDKLGLSNGSYRAGNVQHGKQPVDNSPGLRAIILSRPGTLKIKVRGSVNQRPRLDADRGIITQLTRQALSRHLVHLRELEARWPSDYLITLTYPGNWVAALSDTSGPVREIKEHWARLESLRQKTKAARREIIRDPSNTQADWLLSYLITEMRECRRQVKKTVIECRKLGPDGKKVKSHFNAFMKRFDRKFGTQILETHKCFGAAHQAAKQWRDIGVYVDVKVRRSDDKSGHWQVYAVLYRLTYWLEFQRRGAPHLHMIFFDTRGLNWLAIKEWAGQAWAATVAGLRSVSRYLPSNNSRLKQALEDYDKLRELWGKQGADELFRGQIEAAGLDWGIYNHLRAGTRVEVMRKRTFAYAAKEASKYNSKKYQSRVPKSFRNVGRWWGYRKYKPETQIKIVLDVWESQEHLEQTLLAPLGQALAAMPPGCHRFRKKMERFVQAVRNHEDYGYVTIWGEKPRQAYLDALS